MELDERNVPIIAGTTMKVVELVMAHRAYGWSPEEIHLNHRYLTINDDLYSIYYH